MRCLKCNQRHHSTICEYYLKKNAAENHTPNVKGINSPITVNEPCKAETTATTNMHVSSRNTVLLQTARANVKSPRKPEERNLRFVFDSGSRKSYVLYRSIILWKFQKIKRIQSEHQNLAKNTIRNQNPVSFQYWMRRFASFSIS